CSWGSRRRFGLVSTQNMHSTRPPGSALSLQVSHLGQEGRQRSPWHLANLADCVPEGAGVPTHVPPEIAHVYAGTVGLPIQPSLVPSRHVYCLWVAVSNLCCIGARLDGAPIVHKARSDGPDGQGETRGIRCN